MIKDKQRDKKKNGGTSGNVFENTPTPSSTTSENREECSKKEEKGPDVKEEPEENEAPENKSSHNSPLEEIKSSPAQQSENSCEGVGGVLHNIGIPSEGLHEGVQPLPSNVVNKQPVTMEAQYMQQQSQIFVFSTSLANKAAETVIQGQFASIIAYHCAQPRTKKYLEGTNQQNQIMPNQCSNANMNMDQNTAKNTMNSHHNLMQSHNTPMLPDGMMSTLGELNQDINLTTPQPLAGVKVPDENLTPQQRQHREEQLATLRKMQQILFPEALPGPEENAHVENPLPENIDMNKPPSNHSDWHKLQMQLNDDQKNRKNRASGPPPSYQQATRSASVPIALQSPNPSSPNNTTSNLSLPSPRTCSGINSPADKVSNRIPGPSPTMESPNPVRNANSNPPTPVSSHLSPKHKDKINASNEFSPSSTVSAQNSQQSPVDSLYCRSVQSIGGQKQGSNTGKEPNLMPVPSPQQIQYLNAFEGQELTIQKQPNTSLKETGRKTPVTPPTSLEGVLPATSSGITGDSGSSGANNGVPSSVGVGTGAGTDGGPGSGNYPCIGPDNVPLNPNRISVSAANKSSHFDPISSLAQMSQQLTNNVPNSPVNQPNLMPNMHQNMVSFNSPNSNQHLMSMADLHHMPNPPPDHRIQNQMQSHFGAQRAQCTSAMSPGISVSPKMMQGYGVAQRPMTRPIGYNGANIQVKPNAPNTIQYLPSRPQSTPGPRAPPSLEFLQRFSNPLSNLDAKVPTHNLQYFPNNYPQNNMNDMGMCNPHVNIRGPIRNANPGMMRMQGPQMAPMGFNNSEGFQNANCQIFGPPSKNTSMGLAPDASQPLPPSMGQGNNFKNSTFIGPTTADPNYAQQFHNFQQQLYATNTTRGQLNNQAMGGNQHYFVPK
ncbi:protein BCL9 homolog isoform X2 [Cimex lectularius]|nr:protein BCL9 homolog isoform X2 [Cimex lectularius]XP_014256363.1 protein BCL9 homolog isoform X2 [Cimex lectularius]XP_014256365.1 protein BCL9 homolog isoform X2 [Cimex lectularius]